ncbi:high affinity copper uptake protein 1-like [Gigantopelta aegis]|uniref:high affinity copper uptake protein 1-like n=1 Tax=Gigantopelta aegis TaxID=1735272 RepID=UPI001B888EB9|nr:high affinity copper uptake protein 1-like [Gigantopelta aegis]XP_041368361.1 high affinity copper uptake protein 1-like [Gigantopelta aegis]
MDHSMHSMPEPEAENGMNMNGSDGCPMGMMMYFHTGNCEYVLFEALRTTNAGQMAGACVVIFILGALYEGLKYMRENLLHRANQKRRYISSISLPSGTSGSSKDAMILEPNESVSSKMLNYSHFLQTFLHMLQVFVSYCLMLVFMTYNAWLCLAVILGAGAGYFIFGWKRAMVIDVNEHCH